MKAPDLTVVIVSYNTEKITRKCLNKVEVAKKFCERILNNRVTAIVVDNASSDRSKQMIKRSYPWVRLIKSSSNIGFGRANNLAMKAAKTPLILLLNSDVFLKKETLSEAILFLVRKKDYAALSVKLTYPDGSFQSCGGYLPTPIRTVLWCFGLENIPLIKKIVRPIYIYDRKFYERERTLEWGSSAFFMIKRQVFEKTKGFDEKLFMYFEDIEWCQRIKKAKFAICYTPEISVVHQVGASSAQAAYKTILGQQIYGLLYFHKIHYPGDLRLIGWVVKIGLGLRFLFYSLSGNKKFAKAYNWAWRLKPEGVFN